jgi:hypothetical protein
MSILFRGTVNSSNAASVAILSSALVWAISTEVAGSSTLVADARLLPVLLASSSALAPLVGLALLDLVAGAL